MLISLLIFLLLSNALTMRRDKSILFSRVVIIALISTSFLAWNNLFIKPLEKGIGIYGGLFNVTTFTQTFNTERKRKVNGKRSVQIQASISIFH